MRWGHDFPKDKGEGMLTLSQFGERPCVMGKTHQNCQLPFFLAFFPTIYFFQNVVEIVIAWKGKSMGKFELGRAPSFKCRVLTLWARKNTQNHMPFFSCVHVFVWIHVLGAMGRLAHPSLFSLRVQALRHMSSSCVHPSRSVSVFPW